MANKYLFANLLLLTIGEGGKATSPSFAIRYVVIEASSTPLEALIASLLPTSGIAKEATFPITFNLLIGIRCFFSFTNGERATLPSCASIGAYNASL